MPLDVTPWHLRQTEEPKLRFSIDTAGKTLLVASVPRAETKFNSDEVKLRDGKPVHALDILVMDEEGIEKIRVKIAGKVDVPVQTPVRLIGLCMLPWEKDGKRGVAFMADGLEAVGKLAKVS